MKKLFLIVGIIFIASLADAPRVYAFDECNTSNPVVPCTISSVDYYHYIGSSVSGDTAPTKILFYNSPPFGIYQDLDIEGYYTATASSSQYAFFPNCELDYTSCDPVEQITSTFFNYESINFISSDYSFVDTTSRFLSLIPVVGTTTATTTTIGAQIYINEADYDPDMYLSMSFTNQTLSLTGGSVLDAYNSASGQGLEIHLPLVAGYNNVSTTTTFLYAGRTDGKYTVETDGFLSSLPVLGSFFSPNTLIASSTYFYVGFKSGLDDAVDLGASSVGEFLLTGTTTGANTILNCSNLLSGGLTPCIVSLFVPNATTFGSDLQRLRDGFLAVWPLGYVTRFIEIAVSSATTSMPTISYTTASSSMFGVIDIELDPFGALADPDSPFNYESDNNEDPQTIWEIMEYPTYIVVYLMLLFMIIHDITGISKHAHHKKL